MIMAREIYSLIVFCVPFYIYPILFILDLCSPVLGSGTGLSVINTLHWIDPFLFIHVTFIITIP